MTNTLKQKLILLAIDFANRQENQIKKSTEITSPASNQIAEIKRR